MNKRLEVTPIKDTKPVLVWVGKILGMDLYIDIQGQDGRKYDLAQGALNVALANMDMRKDTP